eukprot:10286152-Alexandrium_andersonii.AAC.1
MSASLVGSEMCIRDRCPVFAVSGCAQTLCPEVVSRSCVRTLCLEGCIRLFGARDTEVER